MASPRDGRSAGPFTLPPIAQMTQNMPQDKSPKHNSVPHDLMRDSGMWSMQSPSKHSSTISSATGYSTMSSQNGMQVHSILNSDDSPHRFSSASAASGNTPGSSRFSHPSRPLPALNRSLTNDRDPRASIDANNTFFIDSRRSSIDSRNNVNFDSLNIDPSSPYDSHNPSHRASEASLASSYQQHARTSNPPQPPRSGPMGPIPRRPVTSGGAAPRRAPAIAPHPRQQGINPNASQPTKGHAWAFPDTKEEDEMVDSITPESSRQGSMASATVHPLDTPGYGPLRHAASHNTLPSKTLTSLTSPDMLGAGNYSRTPELRVSHKLAERKRRSEMKDLFDNLNRILPNSPGNKSSKWEVLSKAIEYIENLQHSFAQIQHDNKDLRREAEGSRSLAESERSLISEITVMYEQICRVDPDGHHVFGPRSAAFVAAEQEEAAARQAQQAQHAHQAHQAPHHPPPQQRGHQSYAMQGVEYGPGYDRR